MKSHNDNKGFSALELLIVVVAVVVLAAAVLPMMSKSRSSSRRHTCIRNLSNVGLGFRLWANDHNGLFPAYQETNAAWNYFQIVGQEKIENGKSLLCPEDASRRQPASDFAQPPTASSFASATFQNNALSYFYGVDATGDKPNMFLIGDRSLSTNTTILSGILSINTNASVRWAKGLHDAGGNLGCADGSVSQLNDKAIQQHVRLGTNGLQRLILP